MKKDLVDFVEVNINNLAISHIEGWQSRYAGRSKARIKEDLMVNHDPSLEIEYAEETLKRELTSKEYDFLVDEFNKAVLKNLSFRGCTGLKKNL